MNPVSWALLGNAVLGIWMLAAVWGRNRSPAFRPYVAFTSALVVWTLAYLWEIEASAEATMLLATKVQYLGIAVIPVSVFWFAKLYTGRTAVQLSRKSVALSLLLPVLTVVLAWTNEYHGLIWSEIGVERAEQWSVLTVSYGGYFWIHVVYSYACLLAGLALVGELAFRNSGLWFHQNLLVILGVCAPWAGNFLRISGLSPMGPLDPTPFAFTVTALTLGVAAVNLRLFSLAPVARDLVLATIEESIVVVDEEGRVVEINRAAQKVLGSDDASLGLPATELLGPFREALAWTPGTPPLRVALEDGRAFDCTAHPVVEGPHDRVPLAVIIRDVTRRADALQEAEEARANLERRVSERTRELREANEKLQLEMDRRLEAQTGRQAAEMQLRQAQRVESIGTFVGGIAHDFNNILAAIMGYTEMALSDLPHGHPVRDDVEQVLGASMRARDLVGQILRFTRKAEPTMDLVCTEAVVDEVVSLLRAVTDDDTRVEASCQPGLRPIVGDPTQLQQVLMNLCVNASHAMPEGGLLEILLDASHAPPGRSRDSLEARTRAEDWLRIRVRDEGIGMAPETLDRAFEPFFTTKAADQGTGLGLSVVRDIVRGLGGEILADSMIHQGTTFSIYLPTSGDDGSDPVVQPQPQVGASAMA